jgi:tetratricopeptide (TPR) repeat protein
MGRVAMRRIALFLHLLILATCVPAQAADDADACARLRGREGIAACDRVIASGRTAGKSLASAHYNCGLALLQLGEHDRAITDFDISIGLDSSGAWAFNNRGSAWYAKGDLDRAMADFSEAIRLDPAYALAYNNRAEIWTDKGDLRQAIIDYGEAIRLDPTYTAAYANRGRAYERLGDIERARADFRIALALPPKYGDGQAAQNTARERLAALARPPAETAASTSNVQASVTQGHRIALIVGNSNYTAVPLLANPRRDSELIAAALRSTGFETVTLVNDLTRDRLVEALEAFSREAREADWAVVYFAGHGMEIAGINYLIPVDARLEIDRDVPFQTVALDRVMAAVEGARKLRLVLLDACRDNPFIPPMRITGGTRAPRGLAPPKPVSGTLIVYAAKQGQVAIDGDTGNSPFAAALAKRLPTPGVEINRLFRLVHDDVFDATGGRQEPFTYGSLPGRDYYFVTK